MFADRWIVGNPTLDAAGQAYDYTTNQLLLDNLKINTSTYYDMCTRSTRYARFQTPTNTTQHTFTHAVNTTLYYVSHKQTTTKHTFTSPAPPRKTRSIPV